MVLFTLFQIRRTQIQPSQIKSTSQYHNNDKEIYHQTRQSMENISHNLGRSEDQIKLIKKQLHIRSQIYITLPQSSKKHPSSKYKKSYHISLKKAFNSYDHKVQFFFFPLYSMIRIMKNCIKKKIPMGKFINNRFPRAPKKSLEFFLQKKNVSCTLQPIYVHPIGSTTPTKEGHVYKSHPQEHLQGATTR